MEKTFKLGLSALFLSLFTLTSCHKDKEVEEQQPALQVSGIEVAANAITFEVSSKAVERVAYICQEAETTKPKDDEVIAQGKQIEANKKVTIKEENLKGETEYVVYVVAQSAKGLIAATPLSMKTNEHGADQIRLDRVLTSYYAVENDETANYVVNLSNADPNQAGNPVKPGDVQVVLSLYNVKDKNPKSPSLPVGTYTLGEKMPFEIESGQSAFYFVNDEGAATALPFSEGTVEVQKKDDKYQIKINLTDGSGRPVWAYYEGPISFPLVGEASFEPFDKPQDITFTQAQGRYYGNWFAPHSDNFHIDFLAGKMEKGKLLSGYQLSLDGFMHKVADYNDPNIRIEAGEYTVDGRDVKSFNCLPMTVKRGELIPLFGTNLAIGSYLKYIDPETGLGKIGYFTSGKMKVEDKGTSYKFTFDFKTPEGQSIKGTFDAPMKLGNFNDNDKTMPRRPWSTIKGDHQISYPKDAKLTANFMGNYLDTRFNTWMLVLASDKGGEMITTELVTPLAAGMKLVAGTYKVGWGVAPFKAFPGMMSYASHDFIYSWFGDTSKADGEGNSTFYAPLCEGTIIVQESKDQYTIVVDAKDDAGNSIKGTWTGKADIKNFSQAPAEKKAALLLKFLKKK